MSTENHGRFIVIENTPGYMPDDDDPFSTEDYSEAVAHMNELADEYENDPDHTYRVERGIASQDNYAAITVWDDSKMYDLGRVIQIVWEADDDDDDDTEPVDRWADERGEPLSETSGRLMEALQNAIPPVFGQESLAIGPQHTGGGTFVMAIDISQDGRGMGRQIWLTREDERTWFVGFYDFAADESDEGIVLALEGYRDNPPAYDRWSGDNPAWVADRLAGLLKRLGVTTLQGG